MLHSSEPDINRAINRFNGMKPIIKSDLYECDVFFSRIMSPDFSLMSYPLHKHSFYEIHIPISGWAEYMISGEKIRCTPDSAVLFSPDNAHHLVDYDSYLSLTVGFSFVAPDSLAVNPTPLEAYTEIPSSPDIYNCISYIFHTLLREENLYIFNNLLSVILHDLLMQIPAFREKFESSNISLSHGHFSDDARIRIAIRYISDNIAYPLSTGDVAWHVMLSSRQLNRILKNAMNTSINQLINEIRIKTAKRYIETTDFSLSKIAMLCGFNSPTHFNITFKKLCKITPKLYRQKKKEQ